MILILGSTGTLGGIITRRLLAEGKPVRILVRPGSNYQPLVDLGAQPVIGDLKDRASLDAACQGVREKLQGYVFGEDRETIDSVVADLFRRKGATLSLAESCTGGLVAKRVTDVPGSSAYFVEGAVTYADAAKVRSLGISRRLLEEEGAVSSATATAMARGMRKLSGSDIALAITGIAGPGGGSEEKPVGTVYLALATRAGCQAKGYLFSGSREEIRTITAFTAMDWLRRHLLSL